MTILGTRPEIIRLSLIIPKLDAACEHVLVHTGQNFTPTLKDVFFEELGVRPPDHTLNAHGSFGEQVATLFPAVEALFKKERPDRLLVLGDTNSGLAAVVAKRMGIPVYHMEAGNRCYDDRVPEEVNRRIIDHSSDVLMPYTERSRQNLLREGIPGERIFVTGNPIKEVIDHYADRIAASTVLENLGLDGPDRVSGVRCQVSAADGRTGDHQARSTKHGTRSTADYFLVTMHRAENVDVESRLRNLTRALEMLNETYGIPVIVSTHPRTRSRMEALGMGAGCVCTTAGRRGRSRRPATLQVAAGRSRFGGPPAPAADSDVRFLEPFGFFDFIRLEKSATCVISDSGTVQEECCILHVPTVTIRDVTERPETIECGSNILSGDDPDNVLRCVRVALDVSRKWAPPPEYLAPCVSETVLKIAMGLPPRG
jgi:UDP-N-acetylglucosamine 2-epimerase (non-hydrolysing)